ncbi:MAG: hypothetical protein RLZZ306_3513 [Bacteroidota bacterium]|jgi:uncharacterized protein (TIGR02284 family)
MNTEESIDVLNNLIVINNDRIDGYKAATTETYKEELRDLFAMLQKTSEQCKNELESEVKRLGGTPEDGTMILGKLHRGWMDIKAAITGSDSNSILDSCEFGEQTIIKAYEDALDADSDEINNEQKSMLNNHLQLMKTDYEKVKSMQVLMKDEV